jgi:peroxiredoxin Q/BCP
MRPELVPGDPAPSFSLERDGGATMALEDFKGQLLILYFYPKADTSGCTLEAQAFSRMQPAFRSAGASVVGVSPDAVRALDKFRDKYGLEIPLLSDPTHGMLEAYGVWTEKSMYGRKYMGVERATFLIGTDARICRIWRKVKVAGHAEEVLAAAQGLSATHGR